MDPYRELFECSADAILIIDGETFVDCNQATVEMLRYETRAQLLRTHPSELSPPTQPDGRDSRTKANEMIAEAFEHGSHRFEWSHLRADKTTIPVEVLLTVVQREGKSILHVVWRDLTERKALEEQLRHAQKMEAIGKLAGGLAHDFNNLLVAILGNSELLRHQVRSQPKLLKLVGEITKAGERGATLIRQLLSFGRKQGNLLEVIDANEVVLSLQSFLERLIGEDVSLVTLPVVEQACLRLDRGQFEQVIVNLVTNARDALPGGGEIIVGVSLLKVDADSEAEFSGLKSGDYAIVSVTDTGTGMDKETIRRAFDPFYTTKAVGKGTGLGLATVYGIANHAGGCAKIDSQLGHGTTVKVALPAVAEKPDVESRPAPEPAALGGNETILVVEDEESVAELVLNVLRDHGYKLLLAHDGQEALHLWMENEGKIDLLLIDVVMPVMGGPELVRQLRAAGMKPRVLFASGYTDNALASLGEEPGEVDLLVKPFSPGDLARRVRNALDRQ